MGHKYTELAFTKSIKEVQAEQGSRAAYAKFENRPDQNHLLGDREIEFIAASRSFYMATVNSDGWPYIQHRGGPTGFLKVINDKTMGFVDYSGNRQYISVGNLKENEKVSLFIMDYANKRRLKLFARASISNAPDTFASLIDPLYPAKMERAIIFAIEAFDWNCPQHIPNLVPAPESQRHAPS